VGVVAYGALLAMLRMREAGLLWAQVRGRLRRGG
jgi:hypothetical protein